MSRRPATNVLVTLAAAAIVAVASFAGPATAGADIVFDGRWNAPGLDNWDTVLFMKSGNRNKLRYVRSPRRSAAAWSADLLVGGNDASERIVFLKDVFARAEGKDDWWAWSLYIPTDSVIPNSVFAVSLFSKFNWPTCGFRGPANSLYMVNPDPSRPADRWRYILTGGKGGACNVRYLDIPRLPVVKKKWIDFSCHYRWSSADAATAETGISKCFYRVEPDTAWTLAFSDVGPNLISTAEFPGSLRVHYGLYKAEAPPYAHFDLGGLVVADTRQEAERAAFGRRAAPAPGHRPVGRSRALILVVVGGIAILLLALVRRGSGPPGPGRVRRHRPTS